MRPIQWLLKDDWHIPESLEKMIPIPSSLHPHLQWWLEEDNVLTGQPLHPVRHALQIFTDALKEGWGTHLNEYIARGAWSLPESKRHINYLELKAVFLALKEFQDLCASNIVLVTSDNTIVVSYINKEGGHEVQQQVTSVCVTCTGSFGHCSGRPQSTMGGSGCICLSTSGHLGQSGGKTTGLPMQENH